MARKSDIQFYGYLSFPPISHWMEWCYPCDRLKFIVFFEANQLAIHTYIHTYIFDEVGQSLATQRAGVDLP